MMELARILALKFMLGKSFGISTAKAAFQAHAHYSASSDTCHCSCLGPVHGGTLLQSVSMHLHDCEDPVRFEVSQPVRKVFTNTHAANLADS